MGCDWQLSKEKKNDVKLIKFLEVSKVGVLSKVTCVNKISLCANSMNFIPISHKSPQFNVTLRKNLLFLSKEKQFLISHRLRPNRSSIQH